MPMIGYALDETRVKIAGERHCCLQNVAIEYKGERVALGYKSQCPHCKTRFTLVWHTPPRGKSYPLWKADTIETTQHCCATCIHFGTVKGMRGLVTQTVCLAPITTDPPPVGVTAAKHRFVYEASPGAVCELWTAFSSPK